jgi:hypothetical protein
MKPATPLTCRAASSHCLKMVQLIERTCLVNEDSIKLGLAQTTHDLRAMRDHGVLPAHKEVISVLDLRTGVLLIVGPEWSNSYSPS